MSLPLIERALQFDNRTAIVTLNAEYSYRQLLNSSARAAAGLLNGRNDLTEARVAFLTPPGFEYAAVQWGIWRAGGIAVPLAVSHPAPELEYVIADSDAEIVVAHPDFAGKLRPVAHKLHRRFVTTPELLSATASRQLPQVEPQRRAMIVYTSGTTGKPKGVVSTHQNIQAQVTAMVSAWGWSADDRILHVLPLHHVHGIVNVLTTPLWVGASCFILPKFNAEQVWQIFETGQITAFMAVPTIYARLIAAWDAALPERRQAMSAACVQMRLMVSGSAALPVSVLEKWRQISGHTLLERYGMTEIGMGLSNPLRGERVPGHVGRPMPGVELRLVDEAGLPVDAPNTPGEIQVRGPGVFREYWQRPQATAQAFQDGWFRTGDTALRRPDGVYRILGRNSVDIIKTGGFKVSALEIEEVLRTHPAIRECAVVGVPDPEWGERVCAALVLETGASLAAEGLRGWAKERLAPYKVPSEILVLDDLPRNAMGKVTKPALKKMNFSDT
ncbi:MAG: long-chain fatty acid--CoA ligase [Chloroflexi bacterium]|nr:MAG: long-chain fatty acid--CoA ligase [Chloroflexota bacterium]